MSAYSTIKITRTAARKYLLATIMDATDEELSGMLDQCLAEQLYDCLIVNDDAENDDERIN